MTPRDLAAALASRLDDVVPAGLHVRADGARVVVLRGDAVIGGSAAARLLDGDTGDRQVATAAYATINAVQEVVAHSVASPWPARTGARPIPQARLDGRILRAWYGPTERPVLALDPVPVR
ncbi:hypothetical protein [Pseudonocardia sp. N23]|uniref:hypothetical protein n=1 Tax=Pseudonocardia sp. N23 TaxID=1987376 RepID=UPI000BFD17C2|nr:hypothetical protein [Pseudonocardia sp. N23]GAY12808.1 hypothetical protein TOK_1358 [Pseudonocardia sp. N23]